MTSQERRDNIKKLLKETNEPISATSLAKTFSVSRQLIVGDVALMRAAGLKITATPRGYVLNSHEEADEQNYTIACKHNNEKMGDELYIIVDNGGEILDVTVEHPIYGQIVGELQIASRYDVELFLEKLEEHKAQPLNKLTDGIHLHRIKCKDEETYNRIINELKKENILLE